MVATLIINRSDSLCGTCQRGASPSEKCHDTVLSWSREEAAKPGCGVEWTQLSSHYMGLDDVVKAMRPDLPFVEGVIND